MKKAISAIMLITILSLIGCQSGNEDDTIKIGSILILTGDGAAWGIAARNGIEMAIDQINADGGVLGKNLVAIHEDDGNSPAKAISAFQKLTDMDQANFIIGTTWSPSGIALIKYADEKKTIMISPSLGMKDFNEGSKYLFNTWPHDFILSQELARLAYNKGHRKVAIASVQQLWVKEQTEAFKQTFEELGGKVELIVEPDPENKGLQADVLKIKSQKDLDAIVITNDITGDIMARRLRDLGLDLPFFSLTIDKSFIKASQGALDGTIFLTSLTPEPEFEKAYKAKYNIELDIGADTGYDAVMLLAQAIKTTGSTDSDEIAAYLSSLKTYDGVSGHLIFDGKGGVTKPFVVKEIKNGEAVTIK